MDILGLGAVAVDDLFFLNEFPRPDSKVRVQRRERHVGGLTATALVAARRMGRDCDYAGTLGDDELSRFVVDGLAAEGVSLRHLVQRAGTRPFHSTILIDTDTRTRTILVDEQDAAGADPALPAPEVIRAARVLLVDHAGLPGMLRAARIARAAGVPVVADLERNRGPILEQLLGLVDHLVLPYDFARELTGAAGCPEIVRALWKPGRAAVVVTRGAQGAWYVTEEEPRAVYHQPAFQVQEVDTNGCGDVFHGVYAAGVSEGMPAEQRIRLAAAVAACKATQPGGQQGIPMRRDADRFCAERSGDAPRTRV
ncbi:MAG: PfkB family carbohydrate kinase [Spirochaetia bacterium]